MRWEILDDRALIQAIVFGDTPKDLEALELELEHRGLKDATRAVWAELQEEVTARVYKVAGLQNSEGAGND